MSSYEVQLEIHSRQLGGGGVRKCAQDDLTRETEELVFNSCPQNCQHIVISWGEVPWKRWHFSSFTRRIVREGGVLERVWATLLLPPQSKLTWLA